MFVLIGYILVQIRNQNKMKECILLFDDSPNDIHLLSFADYLTRGHTQLSDAVRPHILTMTRA